MQTVHPQLLAELQGNERTIVELWEFFLPDEEDFDPANAYLRFANVGNTTGTGLTGETVGGYSWGGAFYERRVMENGRSDIRRVIGKQDNTVSVTLVNNDFALSAVVLRNRLEGSWVQVRQPSIDAPNESLILFAGRCRKPDTVYPELSLTISQDTGASDAEIPKRKIQIICPLAVDFKGVECRGNKALSEHTAAYQAATDCNGSRKQCSDYGNLANNQGLQAISLSGNFTYQVEEVKRFLYFFQKKKKRTVSAPWSASNDAQQDAAIPEVGGIVQTEAVPFLSADTGAKVRYLQILAGPDTDDVTNVIIRDKEYLPAPDTGTQQIAYGDLGSQGQPESVQFPGAGPLSGLTWIEGQAVGSDPTTTNDKAPTLTAVLRGRKYEVPDDEGNFDPDNKQWVDCGPYMARHYLVNEGRLLRSQFDNESLIEAAWKTWEPVIDDTGFEQAVIPTTLSGGVDFRAYASAGGFGAATIDKILLLMAQGKKLTGGYAALVEAYYRYINSATALPSFVAPNRKIRRRYVSNFVIKEATKLSDFLNDILFPSFNGQLIYTAAGKVKIRVDGPVTHTWFAANAGAGASTIAVEDANVWRTKIGSKVILSPHTAVAELNRITDVVFAELTDDPIALSTTAASGLTSGLSNSVLTGATNSDPAMATLTIAGTVAAGASVTLTIDGITVDYTCQAGDDRDAVAGYLAALVNGEPTLRRYIYADWNGEDSTVLIKLKTGYLTLRDELAFDHSQRDEVLRVEAAFGDTETVDQQRYRENTFAWPLGSRSSSYNRFTGTIRSITHDWASIPVERNVIWHQRQTRRTNTLEMNLSAVDTAHQAARLLKIKSGKERYCDWFCSFTAGRDALLLDLGDVIVVSHYSGGAGQLSFIPVQIEEITVDRNQNAKIVARLYRTDIYDDRIAAIDSPILLPLSAGTKYSFTANAGTDTLTIVDNPLAVDDVVYFTVGVGGVLPGGLAENTPYYVKTVVGDDITVSATLGGSTTDITDPGTAPIYLLAGLSASTDTPSPNVPNTTTDSSSGLGRRKDNPDYIFDGYGTGGGSLLD